TAKGVTVIQNAAREPEIADLADFLNAAGAKIRGAGERVIVVEGVERLFGTEHTVIPDRITASTYMAAGAVTGGKVTLLGVLPAHLKPVFPAFLKAGCDIALCGNELTVTPPAKLRPVGDVVTDYYPGFPTDSQPPVLAMAALAVGSSEFTENIFEKRLNHTQELIKMGADIKVTKNMARINGVGRLCGCPVKAEDLRGGAALIVAALAAQGETQIGGMEYILRGYEDIELSLGHLGANIWLKESKLEEEKAVGSK
ncbi:MAG: UDP-N-acetylglucosamine 1-carboxyvinyltransferase, partial [Oscillospiraceae bacterium]|nr:UDP-N-acetylglucosamine 1-carboxyvinyltransferase [Oscillospiraceae bacterium]